MERHFQQGSHVGGRKIRTFSITDEREILSYQETEERVSTPTRSTRSHRTPVDSTQTIVTVDTDTKIFGPVLGSSMDVIDISGGDSEVGW